MRRDQPEANSRRARTGSPAPAMERVSETRIGRGKGSGADPLWSVFLWLRKDQLMYMLARTDEAQGIR